MAVIENAPAIHSIVSIRCLMRDTNNRFRAHKRRQSSRRYEYCSWLLAHSCPFAVVFLALIYADSLCIFLLRTKQIEMKFNEPFFGLAYADFDRNSACQILGKGELSYRLDLPLKGCGTKQVSRLLSNFIGSRRTQHLTCSDSLSGTTTSVHQQHCGEISSRPGNGRWWNHHNRVSLSATNHPSTSRSANPSVSWIHSLCDSTTTHILQISLSQFGHGKRWRNRSTAARSPDIVHHLRHHVLDIVAAGLGRFVLLPESSHHSSGSSIANVIGQRFGDNETQRQQLRHSAIRRFEDSACACRCRRRAQFVGQRWQSAHFGHTAIRLSKRITIGNRNRHALVASQFGGQLRESGVRSRQLQHLQRTLRSHARIPSGQRSSATDIRVTASSRNQGTVAHIRCSSACKTCAATAHIILLFGHGERGHQFAWSQ